MTRILAIDDNNDNLITLGAIIKESFPDLDFDTALSGEKGIELAISTNPDVILLDILMPGMDGFEVCHRLKQDEQLCDIPVVFLTALKEDKKNRIKALEVGGEAFLYKPIDETELVAQIRAMLKIKEFANQKSNENDRLSQLVAERTSELEKSQAKTQKLLEELKSENEKYRNTEKELRVSEEKYRLLHESAGVGIGYYTPDGTVISYNRIAAQNMNGNPEDFEGKSIYTIFPKEDADFYMDRIKKAMNSEARQEYEDRIELPKEVKWFHSVFTRILDSRNKVRGVQIISTDITDRKEAEIALNISESRLKRAELTSGSGNWALYLDSETMIASEGAVRIYGVDEDKFELQYIKNIPLPEYRQMLDLALKNLIEKNQPYQVEFKIRKVDTGEIRDIHSEADFNQKRGIVFGIIQDITERVKRDEALSDFNDLLSKFILHSPIYTFIKEVTPKESRVLKASENFIDMIGIAGSQMVGKNMHELFPPEFAEKITADDWDVASNDHLIQLDEELNGRYYITIKYPIKQGNKTLLAGYTIDITERKKAENALHESEVRFRTLANSGQALIWTSGLDKKCNYFNQTWLDFTGRSIEQELGDGWVEGVHPDDLQHCVETYVTGFDRQEKFSMEYRVRHVSGEYRWIQDDGSPRFNSEGEFIGFIGHCLDITDRKKTEAELRETKNYLENLINYANAPIIVWDTNFRITQFNKAFERLSGRKESEVLGHSVEILFPAETREQSLDYIKKTTTGERWEVVEIEIQDLEMHVHTLLWNSAAIYNQDGKTVLATIAQGQDITDRKHTEEKLIEEQLFNYAIIENLPGIFYLYTYPDLKIIRWNKNHETMLDLSAQELMHGLSEPWGRTEVKDHVISTMNEIAKNGFGQTELSFYKKDGSEIPFILTGVKLDIKDQTYIMGFGLDITDRKKAEGLLKENEARLSELVATKDKFFSIISHDLRNPFNSILGLSNLLVDQIQQKNYEGIDEYAEIIQKSSALVYDLLINLLDWSRLQTGRMEFSPEYVEIVSLINEVIELFDDSVRQKSITIFRELPRNMLIYADKAMISTVLRNLISNAIKFTYPQGQITISAESKKDKVIIAISDNGVGVKKEYIERLFLIGETQTTLGTKNEKGTGLGLILCKEFIEKHGGKICVESEAGKGSKFYFTIPKV